MTDRSRNFAGSRTEPTSISPCPELTDEQWTLIADLFASPRPGRQGGRPRVDPRRCLEGILWVLRTGARWKDLPKSFPSYVTCWRRLAEWTATGLWEKAWRRLLGKLDQQGRLNCAEGFADGTFASAKKGANTSARPVAARAPRSWSLPTATVCPWRSRLRPPIMPRSTSSNLSSMQPSRPTSPVG